MWALVSRKFALLGFGFTKLVVNYPLHNFSEYDEFFRWLIRMNTSKRSHAEPLTFNVVSFDFRGI